MRSSPWPTIPSPLPRQRAITSSSFRCIIKMAVFFLHTQAHKQTQKQHKRPPRCAPSNSMQMTPIPCIIQSGIVVAVCGIEKLCVCVSVCVCVCVSTGNANDQRFIQNRVCLRCTCVVLLARKTRRQTSTCSCMREKVASDRNARIFRRDHRPHHNFFCRKSSVHPLQNSFNFDLSPLSPTFLLKWASKRKSKDFLTSKTIHTFDVFLKLKIH